MCRAEGGDPPEFSRSKTCRARKPHKCDECGRQIEAGELYRYDFMISEGSAYYFHTCAHCVVPAGWLTHNCGGFVFGEVREEIEEHAEEYPDLAPQLLCAIDGMKDGWVRAGQLLPVPAMPDSIEV